MGGVFYVMSSCNPVCIQCHLLTVLNFPQPAFVYLLLFTTLYILIFSVIVFELSSTSVCQRLPERTS